MNFQSMEYFIAIAQERNFTRAAERLHVTQQSLSAHIASVEQELGCQLLIRRIPLELTHAGRVFLSYATTWQESLNTMKKEFSDISDNQKGQLRIGLGFTRSHIIMPTVIKAFQEKYPNIEVVLFESTRQNLWSAEDSLDLVINRFPRYQSNIEYEDFYEEHIVLMVSRSLLQGLGIDPRVVADRIMAGDLSSLAECPFILLGNHDGPSAVVAHELFDQSGMTPLVKVRSVNQNTILALSALGMGACFSQEHIIYAMLSPEQLSQVAIFQLPAKYSYTYKFSYPKQKYQWSVVKDFIRIAREVYPPKSPPLALKR